MTNLERSLRRLHRHVVIKTRANIHELFDANKYGELLPLPEFTFEFTDPSGKLEFHFHGGDFWNPRTEEKLLGRILSCEPLDENLPPPNALPRYWRMKVRFDVKFLEHSMDGRTALALCDHVDTFLNYDSVTKKAKLDDNRFYRKFMRWHETKEGSRFGTGLYFNGRRIARVAEPKTPWEQTKDLPYTELKVSVPLYNTFGHLFQHGTIGDVADFLDRNTDEEIRRHPGISVPRLSEMKEELRRLGYKPKK